MSASAAKFAARVALGELSIDQVPEIRQRSVQWMLEHFGLSRPIPDPVDLVVHLMRHRPRPPNENSQSSIQSWAD